MVTRSNSASSNGSVRPSYTLTGMRQLGWAFHVHAADRLRPLPGTSTRVAQAVTTPTSSMEWMPPLPRGARSATARAMRSARGTETPSKCQPRTPFVELDMRDLVRLLPDSSRTMPSTGSSGRLLLLRATPQHRSAGAPRALRVRGRKDGESSTSAAARGQRSGRACVEDHGPSASSASSPTPRPPSSPARSATRCSTAPRTSGWRRTTRPASVRWSSPTCSSTSPDPLQFLRSLVAHPGAQGCPLDRLGPQLRRLVRALTWPGFPVRLVRALRSHAPSSRASRCKSSCAARASASWATSAPSLVQSMAPVLRSFFEKDVASGKHLSLSDSKAFQTYDQWVEPVERRVCALWPELLGWKSSPWPSLPRSHPRCTFPPISWGFSTMIPRP